MKNILIKTPRLGIILWNSSFPFSHFPHSVNSVASVSSYPQRGLLPGRSNHFQQQTQGIGATCHTVPVTTNDYQCIQAGCQCAGLGIARGCWGTWWRWGERAPPTQRFSSVVGAIKPNVGQGSALDIMCRKMKLIGCKTPGLIRYMWTCV